MAKVSYDFYNPFYAVSITTVDGTKWPLWIGMESRIQGEPGFAVIYENANLGGLTALSFVSEVTVVQDTSGVPTITVVLTPPYEEGRKLLDSHLLEWPGGTLEVELGYIANGEGISPSIFSGALQPPEIQSGVDMTITLVGVGEGGFSAATTGRVDALPTMTRRQALEYFITGPQQIRNLQADFSEIIVPSEANNLLEESVSVSPAGYTDWYLIQLIARQCRCWTLLQGNRVVLRPYQEKLVAPPVRSFYYREIPSGRFSVDVFPMLSYSSESLPDLFRSGLAKGFYQGDIASSSGEEIGGVIDDSVAKTSRTGAGASFLLSPEEKRLNPLDGLLPKNVDGFHVAPGSPEDPVMRGEAVSAYDESAGKGMGRHLAIETLGCPDIFPGDSVGVYGIGRRFDSTRTAAYGAYYSIFSMTHRISGDGFTTSMETYSNIAPFGEGMALFQEGGAGAVAPAPPDPPNGTGSGLSLDASSALTSLQTSKNPGLSILKQSIIGP